MSVSYVLSTHIRLQHVSMGRNAFATYGWQTLRKVACPSKDPQLRVPDARLEGASPRGVFEFII